MSKLRVDRTICLLVAIIIAGTALSTALVIQHLGYEPCVLCLRQRIPYYVGLPLLIAAVIVGKSRFANNVIQSGFTAMGAVSFLTVSGLAGHHVGVETGLWEGPTTCAVRTLDTTSLEAFTAQIGSFQMVSCNTPSITILGLSLAWWNLATSLAVLVILAYALTKAPIRK